MSLERMILLIVGLVVVASVLLAVYVNLNWLWLTGLMGAHLIQVAFTGLCPLVALLKRLRLPQRPGFR